MVENSWNPGTMNQGTFNELERESLSICQQTPLPFPTELLVLSLLILPSRFTVL